MLVEWGNWREMQLRKRRPADQKPWRFAARGGRWQEAVGRINDFLWLLRELCFFTGMGNLIWNPIFIFFLFREDLHPWVNDMP